MRYRSCKLNNGFTLIEVIVGIVALSISLSIVTSLLLPSAEQSAQQIHQIRAAELGQSLMNEITAKAFDEHSDMAGGKERCGEFGSPNCSTTLGREGAEVSSLASEYNDVDDYHNVVQAKLALDSVYIGFTVDITVCNDGNYNGRCEILDDIKIAKLITITITDTSGNPITFATYKANY